MEKGAREAKLSRRESREVILPKGRWYSFWDDAAIEGPGQISIDVVMKSSLVTSQFGQTDSCSLNPQELALGAHFLGEFARLTPKFRHRCMRVQLGAPVP